MNHLNRRFSFIMVLGLFLSVGVTSPVRADSWWGWLLKTYSIRYDSYIGRITPETEEQAIKKAEQEYLDQQKQASVQFLGQVLINGKAPSIFATPGTIETLTFQWLNPESGNATDGPVVSSVLYQANLDPQLFDDRQTLGISTDAAHGFSLPWTVSGYEPLILATPFDANGAPIIIPDPIPPPGAVRMNLAVGLATNLVPEPTSVTLIVIGTAMAVLFRGSPRTNPPYRGAT